MADEIDADTRQKFFVLQSLLDSHPASNGKLFSRSDFRSDASCRCGWTLKFDRKDKKSSRYLFETKRHYQKRESVSKTVSSAKKCRRETDQHILYGFYLKDDTIIAETCQPSVSFRPTICPPVSNPRSVNPVNFDSNAAAEKSVEESENVRRETHEQLYRQISSCMEDANARNTSAVSNVCEAMDDAYTMNISTVSNVGKAIIDQDQVYETLERDINDHAEMEKKKLATSISYMTEERDNQRSTPQWLMKLQWAHENQKINALQEAILETLASDLCSDQNQTKTYPDLSRSFYKLLSLSCSEKDYELIRKVLGGPTGRTLRKFQIDVLSDVNVTPRNVMQAKSFYNKVRAHIRKVMMALVIAMKL